MALKDKILDRAQKYMLKGYIDKALAEYRSAVDIDPRDISIRLRIGDLYVKTNRVDEAIKEYTEVARANAQRGFYPKAIAVYKKVLKLDESNLDIHYKLAELYTKQRLIADAISSYSYIVSTFEKRGKTSEVMELLKKMLEIDPDNVGIRLKLADLFLKLSFEKDAVTEYAQIFAKLIADGKVDRAEKVFLSLYNARPNEPVILHALAEIYRKKGDEVKFLNYARPLLKTYTRNEDVVNALELSKAILALRPDDPAAIEVMRGIEPPELIHPEPEEPGQEASVQEPASEALSVEHPAGDGAGHGESPVEDFSIAASQAIGEEAGERTGGVEEAEGAPLISWPEEEIEISVEGFEDEPGALDAIGEDAFKEEEEFAVTGSDALVEEVPEAPEAPGAGELALTEEPAFEVEAPAEAAAEEAFATEQERPPGDSPVKEFEEPVAEEPFQIEEPVPVEEPVDVPAPVEDAVEAEGLAPEAPVVDAASNEDEEAEVEVEIDLGDYGMELTAAPVSAGETGFDEDVPVEAAIEEAFATEQEQPLDESPVAEIEEPVVEEPVQAEEPVAEEAFATEQESQLDESPVEEIEEPVQVEEPVVDEPVTGETAFEQEVPVEVAAEEAFETEQEQPLDESPVAEIEEPVAEEPVQAEEPVVEEPVTGETAFEQEVPVEVAAEEAFAAAQERPLDESPVEEIEEPAAEEPAVEEPVTGETAFEQEVPVEVAAEEAFAAAQERPLDESPVAEIEEPVAEEPVQAEEPAVEEPVTGETALEQEVPVEVAAEEDIAAAQEQPLGESPVAEIEEPVAEEPVQVEEPIVEEPVQAEEPAAEEPPHVEGPSDAIEPERAESIEDKIERVLSDEPFVFDMPGDAGSGLAAEQSATEADGSAADGLESIGLEDELSSAIEELQARMESDEMLLEPDKVKMEESAPESEFIDLSAELGMEEALEGLAGTWTQSEGESADVFDEYKDGIGHQLSKEDTETHYNLGIAYMEMELFDEASKEFKIALKEPRLEGDCYARLGLCAMAEAKPDEAVMYYLKGLKVKGRSEDERKGMMYELALAYEAAGDTDEALQLFTSISDLDPDYREVAERLSGFEHGRPHIPVDDGLMEVELL